MPSVWSRDLELNAAMQNLRTYGEPNESLQQAWDNLRSLWWTRAKALAADEPSPTSRGAKLHWAEFVEHVWADSPENLTTTLNGGFGAEWRKLRNISTGREKYVSRAITMAVKLVLLPVRDDGPPWKILLYLQDAALAPNAAVFRRLNNWWSGAADGKHTLLKVLHERTLERCGRESHEPPTTTKEDVVAAMRAIDDKATARPNKRAKAASPVTEAPCATQAGHSAKRPRVSDGTTEQGRSASVPVMGEQRLSLLGVSPEQPANLSGFLPRQPVASFENQSQQHQQQDKASVAGQDDIARDEDEVGTRKIRLRQKCLEILNLVGQEDVVALEGSEDPSVGAHLDTMLYLAGEVARKTRGEGEE